MTIYAITKKCSTCGSNKPITEYYHRKCRPVSQCKSCNADYYKKYYRENKQRYKDNYNGERHNEYQKKYNKKKRDSDVVYKLRGNIRNLINQSIKRKNYSKVSKTADIIGCDWITLRDHLQSKFTGDMSWDNYGKVWDVDHIIPVSSAKTMEQLLELNHYSNLQPLESYYNRYIKRNGV